ncbi:Holliday junction resolvase [Paenibacillus sp. DS2015]|uniref:VRR-NUC domain-containing protein n=1 Tax=Paenibacillus sp. DS2015 TaxID=3373917 RepID=UPI003D2447BC
MLESTLERKLVNRVRSQGGQCLKFTSPGTSGVPDRICLFPGGRVVFVEMKAPGEKARPLQLKRHRELQALGFDVRVIDSEVAINEI